ncbi:MAG TPA: hypothetical protein VF065_07760 [Ilumatobacter sp.]
MARRLTLTAVALSMCLVFAGTAAAWDSARGSDASAAAHDDHGAHANNAHRNRIDPVVFHQDMRKLWEDHVTWTRLYIVSAIAELPDLDATANRLLQNQDDIGNAIAAFYGEDAGHALAALLRDHILIAADLVAAAKSGDDALVASKLADWYANADEIATFLAAANPAWPVDTLKDMMRAHLDQTLAQATARLTGDWNADVAAYDEIHLHILHMADTLADGIVEQFPLRFTH